MLCFHFYVLHIHMGWTGQAKSPDPGQVVTAVLLCFTMQWEHNRTGEHFKQAYLQSCNTNKIIETPICQRVYIVVQHVLGSGWRQVESTVEEISIMTLGVEGTFGTLVLR